MEPKEQPPEPGTAPDPDSDDLDDLDDMLDEFSATKLDDTSKAEAQPSSQSSAPGPSGPGRPTDSTASTTTTSNPQPVPNPEDPLSTFEGGEEEFAKQLQAGMAEMLKEMESNPEMAKEFEQFMSGFDDRSGSSAGAAAAPPPFPFPPPSPPTSSQNTANPPTLPSQTPLEEESQKKKKSPEPSQNTSEDAFQDTIRKTMERMKASSSSASAAAAAAPPQDPFNDPMMSSLLQSLQNSSGPGDGTDDDSFSKMLLGMMEQLTNKEILYEPMKELNDKFPSWLAEHGATLEKAERERYEKQRRLVGEIVGRFEKDGYSDSNTEDREYVVERMQEMQAAGAPPPDLVGDVNAANELVNGLDDGCQHQ